MNSCIRSFGVLVALVLACQAPPRSDRAEDIERLAQELDFATGDIVGTVSWNGTPVGGREGQSLVVRLEGQTSHGVSPFGFYQFLNVPPGERLLRLFANGCQLPAHKLAETTTTVSAATVGTVDLDITAAAGRVTGRLLANGTPLSFFTLAVANCFAWQSDQQGNFGMFLPPGTHAVTVFGPSGAVGSFNVLAVSGQPTLLGDVVLDAGSLRGTVFWNGTAVSGQAAQGLMVRTLAGNSAAGRGVSAAGTYSFDQLPPGPRTVELYSMGCVINAYRLAQGSAVVPSGGTATVDFEIGALAGQVQGTLTSNGVPVTSAIIQISGCTTFRTDFQGRFSLYLPPGSHEAQVLGTSGQLGIAQFAVTAGSVTDVGTLEMPSGRLEGTISWNGAPVSGGAASAMVLSVASVGSVRVGSAGKFVIPMARPGTFVSQLFGGNCTASLLREAPVTISGGQTTTMDVELTPVAGRVLGRIRVNGQPLPSPGIQVGSCSGWQGDASGVFGMYLPAGIHTGRVSGQSGVIGQFDFAVRTGESTDVDIGTTPVGSDIEVELSGGLGDAGGVSLVFDNVVSGGNTTVVESGAGPPPPSGYRLVGLEGRPRYWDITSTATFTGTIKVCIQYDPAEVRTTEDRLRLVHDEGSGFVDITTSIDQEANIICGETTSLSPFAIVEPDRPDADADGVADEEDNCPSFANADQADVDGDRRGDACDVCPQDSDNDADADGLCVPQDNCPALANPAQTDTDGDQEGDACDADDDSDGIADTGDNCPLEANAAQLDRDSDGAGDVCDSDDDGDRVNDSVDRCLGTGAAQVVDSEGCSIADRCPCAAAWKSHGAYVSCVSREAENFLSQALITEAEKDLAVSAAGQSACGVKK